MQTLEILKVYSGKKVLITGHTGFKGSWLTLWLADLGATIYGYALPPPTDPSMFRLLRLHEVIDHQVGDIRDSDNLIKTIGTIKPDIIFHLAGQSPVKGSHDSPLYAMEVNTLGTVNLLEAVRQLKFPVAMVMVTTDKCYEEKKWFHAYREDDSLGGYDPYSASKAAAELVISSWRTSFFPPEFITSHGVRIASVRAGNLLGGGDWTKDGIVPDCIRALEENKPIDGFHPKATRPWQHVLEALGGYLVLGAKLLEFPSNDVEAYCDAFNFGAWPDLIRDEQELVEKIISCWGKGSWRLDVASSRSMNGASSISLSIDKAYRLLKWCPRLDFDATIGQTVDWYKFLQKDRGQIRPFTLKQIRLYAGEDGHRVERTSQKLIRS